MLATDDGHVVGSIRVGPDDVRLDLQRLAGHGQDPPSGVQQSGHEVEAGDGIAQLVPEGDDQQVAHRMPAQRAIPTEPVLEHVAPDLPPRPVVAEGGQRHPQVARRQDVELVAQPTG